MLRNNGYFVGGYFVGETFLLCREIISFVAFLHLTCVCTTHVAGVYRVVNEVVVSLRCL